MTDSQKEQSGFAEQSQRACDEQAGAEHNSNAMLAASIPGLDPVAAVAALQPSYQHTKMGFAKMLRQIIFIALGSIMMGVGLELFLVPNQITDGGVTGISIILSHITSVPLGVFLFLLNLPFLIMGYKQIGKTFALSTLLGVAVMSFSTALLHPVQPFTENTFLAAVFGGIILGIGVGLVIRFGARWTVRKSWPFC